MDITQKTFIRYSKSGRVSTRYLSYALNNAGYGHNKLAEGGYTGSLDSLLETIATTPTDPSKGKKTEEKSASTAENREAEYEINKFLPQGKYSNSQKQAQKEKH